MTGKLEDNLYLALLWSTVISVFVHYYLCRVNYVITATGATTIASIFWVGLIAWHSGSISNIWPIAIAVWFALFLPVGLLSGLPVRMLRPKPIPPGHCTNCGYNLTGNISGICPECGERIGSID